MWIKNASAFLAYSSAEQPSARRAFRGRADSGSGSAAARVAALSVSHRQHTTRHDGMAIPWAFHLSFIHDDPAHSPYITHTTTALMRHDFQTCTQSTPPGEVDTRTTGHRARPARRPHDTTASHDAATP